MTASTPATDTTSIVNRFHWDWYQQSEPGAELLGDLTGRTIAEAGAGSGRQAAYLATACRPVRVVAIDSDPARHQQGRDRYGHLPGLELVHADVVTYMKRHGGTFDVVYSVFGALDFTDPHMLLPSIAAGLRPGGRLVFSTLAHYRGGKAPETEVRPARIPVRRSDGTSFTMLRWVLEIPVWHKLLDAYGFDSVTTETVRDSGHEQGPPMTTNVFTTARR